MPLKNDSVIWITGASSGIGKELAIQLDKLGHCLVLSARDNSKLIEVKRLCHSENVLILPLDLEQPDDFPSLAKKVVAHFGTIDILINNGGISQRSLAAETPSNIDKKIMNVNYFGAVALTKAVLPIMKKQGNGHIVVISSIVGKFGFYLRSAYSASKHALQGFYESLRLEEEKNGIVVTIAFPGKIQTEISKHALTANGSTHGKMDYNQRNGLPVKDCVIQLIKAIEQKREEVLIGGKEIKAVLLKRFFPKLFGRIIRKQKAK